jgi:hypothetical protein
LKDSSRAAHLRSGSFVAITAVPEPSTLVLLGIGGALAAIAMVAAVGMIGSWYGTKAPVFAIVRLVALALSGYACLGLACWAVVFEVTFALLGVRRAVRDP